MSYEKQTGLSRHERDFINSANSNLERVTKSSGWNIFEKIFTKRPQLKEMFNKHIQTIKDTYKIMNDSGHNDKEILDSFKLFYGTLLEMYGILIALDDTVIGDNPAQRVAGELKNVLVEYHEKQTKFLHGLLLLPDRLSLLKEKLLLIPRENLSKKIGEIHELCGNDLTYLSPLNTVLEMLKADALRLEGEKTELQGRISLIEQQSGNGSEQAKLIIEGLRGEIATLQRDKERLISSESTLRIEEARLNGELQKKSLELANKTEELRKAQSEIDKHAGLSDAQLDAFEESSRLRKRFDRLNTIFVPPELHSHISFAGASNQEFDMMLGVVSRIASNVKFEVGDALSIRPHLQYFLPSPPRQLAIADGTRTPVTASSYRSSSSPPYGRSSASPTFFPAPKPKRGRTLESSDNFERSELSDEYGDNTQTQQEEHSRSSRGAGRTRGRGRK